MRTDDFGENSDGGKWTFRGGNSTWGNSEYKIFNFCVCLKFAENENRRFW